MRDSFYRETATRNYVLEKLFIPSKLFHAAEKMIVPETKGGPREPQGPKVGGGNLCRTHAQGVHLQFIAVLLY